MSDLLWVRVRVPQQDWEVEQRRTAKIEDEEYDRGFYLRDDGGGAVEDSETANPFLGDEKKFAAKEAENAKLRWEGGGGSGRGNCRRHWGCRRCGCGCCSTAGVIIAVVFCHV